MTNQYQASGTDGAVQGAGSFDARRFEGVRTRRMLAFVVDYTIVGLLWLVALIPVFFLGIVTLGLAWMLYPILGAVIALLYIGTTMSGPRRATWGMSFFSLQIERLDGTPLDFMTAVVHGVLFWAAHIVFTPLLLVVALFTSKKQLVQDILVGTVVVRADR